MMAPFLPADLSLHVSWTGVLEGVALGFVVVMIFSFLPLNRLKEMRPMMIFRNPSSVGSKKRPYYLSGAFVLIFFFGVVLWHMHDVRFGLYFVGGIAALVIVATLLAQLTLWAIGRRPVHHLVLRQAIKGLFRRGNATRSIIITLTVSLSVIYANYLIEKNLDAAFVQSYPKEAPNTFFVDIQPDQKKAFMGMLGRKTPLYPIIRARIAAINGVPINRQKERKKRRDNFSRVFNLTYRHYLLEDETLVKGESLFNDNWSDFQVSILDTVAEMHPMDIGDTISFKIQGVPLSAQVSSIRTRTRSSFSPFFYFVFPGKSARASPPNFLCRIESTARAIGELTTQYRLAIPKYKCDRHLPDHWRRCAVNESALQDHSCL